MISNQLIPHSTIGSIHPIGVAKLDIANSNTRSRHHSSKNTGCARITSAEAVVAALVGDWSTTWL